MQALLLSTAVSSFIGRLLLSTQNLTAGVKGLLEYHQHHIHMCGVGSNHNAKAEAIQTF
jgi:hypothetical protein